MERNFIFLIIRGRTLFAREVIVQSGKMVEFGRKELDEIYEFAVDLGKRAGQLLLDGVEKRIAGSLVQESIEKENAVDIVTKTDEGI